MGVHVPDLWKTCGRAVSSARSTASTNDRWITHVAASVRSAATNPIIANCRPVRTSCPTSATTPAIAVPTCAGPPFRKARVWSRRSSGTTLTSVSHAGEATPWSHTPVITRSATTATNPDATSRIANDPR